jgi:hypothetical protein
MIRRLRRMHRVVFVFLALGIPVLLARAFASRPLAPLSPSPLPPATTIAAADLAATWMTRLGPLRYRLEAARADSTGFIALGPAAALRAPDLLVYWTTRPAPLSTIEDADLLLGRLDGEVPVIIRLPLGHRSVVGTLELPATQGPRP